MDLKKYKLGDIADIIPGYAFKSTDFLSGENIVIKIKDIEPPFIDVNNADKVGFRPNDKYRLEYGDFVLAMTGATIGKVGVNNTHIPNVYINQRVCKFIPNEGLCDKNYLYYLLNTDAFRNFIYKNIDSASAQPNIGHPSILKFEHYFPNIEEQKRIGNLLSSLDQKIALNRKINDNLEAIAKQLYDYWFVQFDFPNEEGNPYKSSGGKMVWNEKLKQEIPDDWSDSTLSEICVMYQPQTIGTDLLLPNGVYRVYGANGIVGKYDQYNHEDSEIAMACRGNSCGVVNRTMPYSWITGNAMVLQMKDKGVSNEYIKQSVSYMNISGAISGSGQPQLTRENLNIVKCLKPTHNILLSFSQLIEPIVTAQLHIIEENDKITKLRDELLPLLMNGQVSVNYHLS